MREAHGKVPRSGGFIALMNKPVPNPNWPVPNAQRRRGISGVVAWLLILLVVPILIPGLVCYLAYCALFRLVAWVYGWWRGVHVLVVYSDSPLWREYMERKILPHLPASAIHLNWSERSRWKWSSFPVRIFQHFGGRVEFNPLVLIFRPFCPVRIFRFWRPFKELKHGRPEALEAMRAELLKAFGRAE